MRKLIEQKLSGIEIPVSLHERCVMGVTMAKQEMEENTMTENTKIREKSVKHKSWLKQAVAAAAVLTVCVVTVSNTSVADSVKGFFRDITGWDGAVVGTEYVQATDEVEISVLAPEPKNGKVLLPIEITFQDVSKAPFNSIEEVTLGNFKIVDEDGKEVVAVTSVEGQTENKEKAAQAVNSGNAYIDLPISAELVTREKEYTLIIKSIYGSSKGDAPLEIKGNWECKFEVR